MHFLTAAIILAMDVCFNPDKDQIPHRKQQVLRACRALDEDLNAKLVAIGGPLFLLSLVISMVPLLL